MPRWAKGGMMNKHELKTWPRYFAEIANHRKTFDLRTNDRGFKTGDTLILREWDPKTGLYTGRKIIKRIGFMVQGEWGLSKETCAMSLLRPTGVDPDCPGIDEWLELDEQLPGNEEYIDVMYGDGSAEFGVRPVSVDLMEVEFWRKSDLSTASPDLSTGSENSSEIGADLA